MNDDNLLGGVLGQLGQTVKQTAKQIVKLPEEMAKDAGEQIGGSKKPAAPAEGSVPPNEEEKQQWKSDEERIKFLRDLYGSAEPSSDLAKQNSSAGKNSSSAMQNFSVDQNSLKEPTPSAAAKAMADKEEQKKLIELRNKLHKENYYDPAFNPPPAKPEERPAEKVEQEKKKEMQELEQKEAEKPPPLAVQRERNKAEMFRGIAG